MIISKYKAPPKPPLEYDISNPDDVELIPFSKREIKSRHKKPLYHHYDVSRAMEGCDDPVSLSRKSSRELNRVGLDNDSFSRVMMNKFKNNLLVSFFINSQWCVFNGKWGASDAYEYTFEFNGRSWPYYLKFFLCSDEYAKSNLGKVLGIVSFHKSTGGQHG